MFDTFQFNSVVWFAIFMKFACTNYPLSAEKIDNYTDVIYKNETFSQSDRYYYTEYIRWNQLSPVIFDDIKLLIIKSKPLSLTPSIPLMYFGEHFSSVSIFPQGVVSMQSEIGKPDLRNIIQVFDGKDTKTEVQIKGSENYLAIKWFLSNTRNSKIDEIQNHVQVVCIVYSNGNISVYFEQIPNEIEADLKNLTLKLIHAFADQDNHQHKQEIVSTYLVKSGMLVEFTPIPDCSKYKFCEDCSTKEYTPGRKCHWCPKFDQCKHPRDFNVDTLLKQDCIIQQVESCPVSTSTPMPHISVDQLNDRPDEEIIKPVTSTTENATTGSQTNENTKSTLPLIMTDQSNQTDNYPTNNPTTILPSIMITNQSSDNLMHNTTSMNVETTSSNPIKSNHPLLSRDIRQIYSITHINQVSMRFYFHLLMPFMIVAVVSIISITFWLIKRRLRIVNFQIT